MFRWTRILERRPERATAPSQRLDNLWLTAAGWMTLALAGSILGIRLGLPVALADLVLGAAAGTLLGFHDQQWMAFLAGLGSLVLTFLAGAEIAPDALRANLRASVAIGAVSFAVPFVACWALAALVLGWERPAAQMAGIVLGETSVAIVYAVTVEAGISRERVGAVLLGACFVTGALMLGTLGLLFANYDAWTLLALAVTALVLWQAQSVTRWVLARWGGRMAEVEIKLLLVLLLGLAGLWTQAGSTGALPAYLLGLAVARLFVEDPAAARRLRSMAFALLTPIFFLRAGALTDLSVLIATPWTVGALLGAKLVAKAVGVWPATRLLGFPPADARYITLLISTGLTLANIAALHGLTQGLLTREQYTALIAAVAGSAVLPTLVAARWFAPGKRGEATP